jgi:hypothetical protein
MGLREVVLALMVASGVGCSKEARLLTSSREVEQGGHRSTEWILVGGGDEVLIRGSQVGERCEVRRDISVTNSTTVEIRDIKTSCGCAGATLSTRRIEPNSSAELLVIINNDDPNGKDVSVVLFGCEEGQQKRIRIRIDNERAQQLVAVPSSIDLGFIPIAATQHAEVRVRHLHRGAPLDRIQVREDRIEIKGQIAHRRKGGDIDEDWHDLSLIITTPTRPGPFSYTGKVSGGPEQPMSTTLRVIGVAYDSCYTKERALLMTLAQDELPLTREISIIHPNGLEHADLFIKCSDPTVSVSWKTESEQTTAKVTATSKSMSSREQNRTAWLQVFRSDRTVPVLSIPIILTIRADRK